MADTAEQPYLLIGTPAKVCPETTVPMRVCKNIFEGIMSARQHPCKKIYVVYSELPEPKSQALDALHHTYPEASICLLIQMSEEPAVRQWLSSCSWSIDRPDYLVCPVSVETLMPEMHQTQYALDFAKALKEKDKRIKELETLVTQDDLTGLKNRRYLKYFLPSIIQRAQVQHCHVTLLLFDIDDFKHYNDSYGHSVGDEVLRQTAKLIRRCCRNQDVVVRLGGDEFAVVFWDLPGQRALVSHTASDRRRPSQAHPREALFMAERFRNEMSGTPFEHLGPKGRGALTISGGLATFPVDAQNATELFERADQAMLEAKRSGKNRISLVGQST